MYDSAVITLILVVDSIGLWLAFRAERRKAKVRNSRKFNKILQAAGLK